MKIILAFLGCFCWVCNTYAQVSDSVITYSRFNNYLQNNFQEKLYVHTDKTAYLAGEIIWFKIYNVESYTNVPVNLSKVAYVEILNDQNKPISQSKITLKKEGGDGAIYLPITVPSGSYTLRAYTNWMKNFDAEYFYHQNLNITNTLTAQNFKVDKEPAKAFNIQFFPEGGNLVSDLKSKVAFKAVDEAGKPFAFSAVVLNKNKDTVNTFSSTTLSIGHFFLTPQAEETYQVLVKPKNGEPFYVALPEIYQKGLVMSLQIHADSLLHVTLQSKKPDSKAYKLLVHTKQKLVYYNVLEIQYINKGFTIPTAILGDGMSHFTLFDFSGNAICERLYFKRPAHLLNINLSAAKAIYKPREAVEITAKQLYNSIPKEGSFSIAVYQADSTNQAQDIAATLWLSSELKGKIENASWYLHEAPPEALDNLMLTHGWRRFSWDKVFNPQQVSYKYLPEVDGHIITGRVINAVAKVPEINKSVYFSIPGQNFKLYTSLTDSLGQISFYTNNYYGGKEIIVQADSRIDSLLQFEIYHPFHDKFAEHNFAGFKNTEPENLLKRSVAMQVNNAFHAKDLMQEIKYPTFQASFYTKADRVYKLDDYVRFSTMEEVLREYVPEITVSVQKKNYQLKVFDSAIDNVYDKAPLMLIDGVPVFDEGNAVIQTDTRKIKRLEIVTSAYQYGNNIFNGIASFTSFNEDLAGYQLPNNALIIDYEGLQNKREFYSPMYNGDTSISRIPDYRTTLFWSPNNRFNKEGQATLNFHTSDLSGKYIVEVQSLSDDGHLGTAMTTFTVNENKED